MIVEDTLLQYRARQRHQRKRLWSSFDDSGFEAFGTFGLGVGGDGAEEFLSQTAPCLAGALSHFGGEAQGGIQRALEGQPHRVLPDALAASDTHGLLHQ